MNCTFFVFMKKHTYMRQLYHYYKITEIDESFFVHNTYWTGFYGDVEEDMPPKMLKH